MAFTVERDLVAKFKAYLGQQFGTDNVNKGIEAMGKEAIAIMRNRTLEGVDVTGKPFAKLTPKYSAIKQKFIAGKSKRKAGGLAYRAKGMPNHMRLTGELFDDMAYSVTKQTRFVGNNLTLKFRLYIKTRSAPKAHGLINGSYGGVPRNFFGIAESGSRKLREQAVLFAAFKRASKIKGTGTL